MKFIRYALVIAASLVLPACNDDVGPTAPVQSPGVAGHWQGNVTFQPLVGFYEDPPCPEQPVAVQFEQQGSTVTGTIQSECVTAQFVGRASQGTIFGRVTQVEDGQPIYSASLSGSLVGSPLSGIEAGTEIFVNSNGWRREAFRLRLTR